MTKKKIELKSFYQALLDVKAGKTPKPVKIVTLVRSENREKPPVIKTERSILEDFLYSNLRFWLESGLKTYIKGTPLADNSSNKGFISEPPRKDDQVISDVKYDKGISLLGYMGATAHHNIIENKLYEEALENSGKELDVIKNITMSIINEIVEELIDEYEFDLEILMDSYNERY
jgi:hypothetical protein